MGPVGRAVLESVLLAASAACVTSNYADTAELLERYAAHFRKKANRQNDASTPPEDEAA